MRAKLSTAWETFRWLVNPISVCLFCSVACLLISLRVGAQNDTARNVGLRDRFALGLSVGSTIGVLADARIAQMDNRAVGVEATFGAGVGTWGLGEAWSAAIRTDVIVADDRMRNALLISPLVGFGQMIGEPHPSGWFNLSFAPYSDLAYLFADLGISWAHQFSAGWSTQMAIRPGESLALGGRDEQDRPARGEVSFRISGVALICF